MTTNNIYFQGKVILAPVIGQMMECWRLRVSELIHFRPVIGHLYLPPIMRSTDLVIHGQSKNGCEKPFMGKLEGIEQFSH